uniref:Purine nucleoside phosphorylase n=1 Tax=Trypanosoma congolense (strain IL3000) TaxID=1068625 RepID=G0UQU6_TRYCI|nr:putative methylthioadenosine phosphorylase [Trypanosoma congolense IL3000]
MTTEGDKTKIMYTSPHDVPVLIGVIGGTGTYSVEAMQNIKHYTIPTPYGMPSGNVWVATVSGVLCAFIARHGYNHEFTPDEVNYRANVYAMKLLGVKYLIGANAVGSLDEKFLPGDIVLADQIIDRTTGRHSTFFGNGIVAHVDYAYPLSAKFRQLALDVLMKLMPELIEETGASKPWKLCEGATLVTMSGPQFSTRAESFVNKNLGGHLIGMTTATEAKLAREAEMAYLVLAAVTDMDAWTDGAHVDSRGVREVMALNVRKLQVFIVELIKAVASRPFDDPAHSCMEYAVTTKPSAITKEVRQRVAPLLVKYPQYAP